MINKIETHILKLSCRDQIGIVSKISTLLANSRCNIVESKQFTDHQNGNFFIRQSFTLHDPNILAKLEYNLNLLSKELNAEFFLGEIESSMNTIMMVSKFDHCLNDLLFRIRSKSLNLNVKAIISNHKIAEDIARFSKIPFYFLPINKTNKENQEAKIKEIIYNNDIKLIVLARYMQVLSEDFTNEFEGKIINIHHSFLPSFKGAKPYHQAYEKGVKILGATAHYVSSDLDEGPIIDQSVERVDHAKTPKDLELIGRDLESITLARAVKYHIERRIFINKSKTVIFS